MTKELIAQFERGTGVTDSECLELYKFYAELERSLALLGPTYKLAWFPVMLNKQTLESFLVNRKVRFNFL